MSASESTPKTAESSSTGPSPAANPKQRSCVTCRARKVRCNKASPCNHCQRAGISCIFPTPDRIPRWARRLNQQLPKNVSTKPSVTASPAASSSTEAVAPVMDRLHKLESLVRELSSQLRQEQQDTGKVSDTTQSSPSPAADGRNIDDGQSGLSDAGSTEKVQQEFGRLVVDESKSARYVSSGFWSRIKDELDSLRTEAGALADQESDFSEEEAEQDSPGQLAYDSEQAALERGAFLFRGPGATPTASSTEELHPSPTQVPLMLAIFTRNVNSLFQVVHMPAVMKIVQERHEKPSHANDALLFAIYYATIASMEEEDVANMLGGFRQVLNRKYRFGVEQCLAKADFLNVPDLVLIQALATFLLVLRRDESPRYVWMMTGLVIRMAMALGLHRDGAKLKHLSPYEIEIRRRVWYVVLGLDLRSSEDQGVDLTIPHGSFDTQVPLNVNDLDLDPNSTEQPVPREGFTDMTFALYSVNTCRWTRDTFGPNRGLVDVEKRLNDFYTITNESFLKVAIDLPDMTHWIGYMVLRLVIAKMTLILYMPELFSTPADKLPPDFRTKLFMSALEVAEINYALNAEPKARHWRWIVQTYTQWHAIVILLIEISRRPWSHTVERAWNALQSKWLIPNQESMNRSLRVWIPLRKLIAQAKRHRSVEVERLRRDPEVARRLEEEDETTLVPPRGGGLYEASAGAQHKERWRVLVGQGPAGEGMVHGPSTAPGIKLSGTEQQLSSGAFLSPATVEMPSPAVGYAGGSGLSSQQQQAGQPGLTQATGTPAGVQEFQMFQGVHPVVEQMTAIPSAPVGSQQQGNVFMDPTATGTTGESEPWLWADLPTNASTTDNMFDGINLEGVDLTSMDMEDMYSRVDWMDWLGTARDVETGKIPDGLDNGAWGMGSSL